uniref:hypothetical protein n=1 Tax=Salipaludibacillus keqinensis TaxID=2045207 RepID=UPI001304A195
MTTFLLLSDLDFGSGDVGSGDVGSWNPGSGDVGSWNPGSGNTGSWNRSATFTPAVSTPTPARIRIPVQFLSNRIVDYRLNAAKIHLTFFHRYTVSSL